MAGCHGDADATVVDANFVADICNASIGYFLQIKQYLAPRGSKSPTYKSRYLILCQA